MTRPVPVADKLSKPFWEAVNEHRLVIQRCTQCLRYFLPPVPFCTSCESTELTWEPVSGRGRIYSFSITWDGARQAVFEAMLPYIVGFVELEEQSELYMYTNLPGAAVDDVTVGDPVQVEFESIDASTVIPQFRVVRDSGEVA